MEGELYNVDIKRQLNKFELDSKAKLVPLNLVRRQLGLLSIP